MAKIAVLGDVHGDYDRMLALVGQIEPSVPLIAVGDYFDRWNQALEVVRWLMARPNTTALLGNHDALILGALEESLAGEAGKCTENWLYNGGEPEDLKRLLADPEAADWLRERPAMMTLGKTLIQHCDSPVYLNYGGSVAEVNANMAARLRTRNPDILYGLFADLCRRRQFYQPNDLSAYLKPFGADVLIHGHTPHNQPEAVVLFKGQLVNVDGALSRGFGPRERGFVYWIEENGTKP